MADVRKIKVLEVNYTKEFKPEGKQFIIYYFSMRCESNGEELFGEFSTNGKAQTKFLIGNEYEVDIVTKSNRKGEYLWFNYSEAEKEKRKSSYSGGSSKSGKETGWTPYVRPRIEVMSIITQSSYEAAMLTATKLAPDTVNTHKQIADVAKKLSEFIVDMSGLNTTEVKAGNKESLKAANDKSIVYQKALKLAVQALDINKMEAVLGTPDKLRTTQGIIDLTQLIVKDINDIANGL